MTALIGDGVRSLVFCKCCSEEGYLGKLCLLLIMMVKEADARVLEAEVDMLRATLAERIKSW